MAKKMVRASLAAVSISLTVGAGWIAFFGENAFAISSSPEVKVQASSNPAIHYSKGVKKQGNHRQGRFRGLNVSSEAAAILKVKPIDIIDSMVQGKKLVDIAIDHGLTKEQFLQKLTEIETKIINDAAKAGTIPQQQADALMQGMQDRLTSALEMTASKSSGMSM
jgi:hypothetical protein